MAEYTERTTNIQLELYVKTDGTFERAIATRLLEVLKDGVVIAERKTDLSLTLQQVKNQVANLT